MEKDEYLKQKIKDFEHKHYYMGYLEKSNDPQLKRNWKCELQQKHLKWQNIRCTKDVLDLIESFDRCVSFVERLKIGRIEDGYNMALALYNALQGLKKMAQCINISGEYADFAEISIEDIDQMFNYLEKITVRMNDQNTRRAMQD